MCVSVDLVRVKKKTTHAFSRFLSARAAADMDAMERMLDTEKEREMGRKRDCHTIVHSC